MTVSFLLALMASLPDALFAVWLMLLGKGVLAGDGRLVTAQRHPARAVGHGHVVPGTC
jgi:hypothetical protein